MNARKRALVNFIKSGAEDAEKWRKNNCGKCSKEALCFPGSIDTSRIRGCEYSTRLISAYMRLIETGVAIVGGNFYPIEINLEGLD